MTNTMIRCIDDIGRVAIPKEIRKILAIKEGDPLEIQYNCNGDIILHKYRKTFERCCHEWYETNGKLINKCQFVVDSDYTFCIVYPANGGPTRAGYTKRFAQDTWDSIIGRTAAYANAMGRSLNKMIGYEE